MVDNVELREMAVDCPATSLSAVDYMNIERADRRLVLDRLSSGKLLNPIS